MRCQAFRGMTDFVLLFPTAWAGAPSVHAESDESRFYIGPRIIGSLANMDVDSGGYLGTVFVEQDDDFVLSGGGVLGYSF